MTAPLLPLPPLPPVSTQWSDQNGRPTQAFAQFMSKLLTSVTQVSSSVNASTASSSAPSSVSGVEIKTASYTPNLKDASGTTFQFNSSTPVSLTIDPQATVAFPIGTTFQIIQGSSGQVSIVAGAGVTITSLNNNLNLSGEGASATIQKVGNDQWVLSGDLQSNTYAASYGTLAGPVTMGLSAVMAGMAVLWTPLNSGILRAEIKLALSPGSSSVSVTHQIRIGTGAAPAAGDPATGTPIGFSMPEHLTAVGENLSSSNLAVENGLSLGTQYWVDFSISQASGSPVSSFESVTLIAQEIP